MSIKRISITFVIIMSLAVSPMFMDNSNSVHASKQNDISKIANSKIGKTSSHFRGFTRGAWCDDFVWWAAKQAKLTNGKTFPKSKLGGVRAFQNYYSKKGRYKKATSKFKPQKGDLAIFGSSSHIGIVTAVSGNYVYVTHGNWGGKVRKTKIKKVGYDSRAHASIKGYARLNYLASEPYVKVRFNANGGKTTRSYKNIRNTTKVGTLPNATRSGYKFLGWYTSRTGGKRVYTSTKFDIKYSVTLYARYKKLPTPPPVAPAATTPTDTTTTVTTDATVTTTAPTPVVTPTPSAATLTDGTAALE